MKAKMISQIKEEKERLRAQKLIKKIFTMWLISLFLILGHFSIGSADDQIITTAVGRGIGDNGPALEAIFRVPAGAAFYNGEMFIADQFSHRVRKVNLSTGIITTVAGTGIQGSTGDGGSATEARLDNPRIITFDEEGNLYITVISIGFPIASKIRKVDPSGIITTFAGNGPPCSSTDPCGDGGPAVSARLSFPVDMVIKDGNLYLADNGNHRVRKIDLETTTITTVAGTGNPCQFNSGPCGDGDSAIQARLLSPTSIALDDLGNIYILEGFSQLFRRIRKVDSSGIITTFAGSLTPCSPTDPCGDGGPAASATFKSASDLAVEAGYLYVADRDNHKIRKIDLESTIITTVAGTGIACSPTMGLCGDGGLADDADLHNPEYITHDATGNLYVSDVRNNRVRKIDKISETITTVAGMVGKGDGGQAMYARLDNPDASDVDCGGSHFLAESHGINGNRIRKIDMSTGIITTFAGTGIVGTTGDGGPAVDAQIFSPTSVSCNSTGTAIYFSEPGGVSGSGFRVRKVNLDTGIISTVAGNGMSCFPSTDPCGDGGPATTARLSPTSAIERDGNLYIADGTFSGRRIRRVDPDGMISTVVGTGSPGFTGDGGPALAATISFPDGLNFDSAGNLFFTSSLAVRMVTPGADELINGGSGEIINRVAGTYDGSGFFGDGGPALSAKLSGANTLVIDPDGILYFTQQNNNIVSRVDLSGIISTVAGMGTFSGFFGDGGPATSALLRNPSGMAMDAAGNTYIDDLLNHRVRRLNEAAAYCDIDPDTVNSASKAKWATMYYEPVTPHTSDQIVKTLIYAVDVNGERISDVLESEAGSPMSTTADSNGNGVSELMRKFNRASIQALVDEPQTVHIVIEVLFDDGRYGACSHVIRVVEPPKHVSNTSTAPESVEEETVF